MQLISSLITLVISLLMILFFRQADKNSRSIEKAKRYGDRIKDEIEGFVKERTENLREAAIELDAKMSQAIAAVKRLDGLYENFMKKSDVLTSRSASIESIEKTASDAEQTIHTVMDMTALAEKNLSRVSKEADFVDSLAKKITEVHNELAYISKVMPEMQDTFRKQNEEHLQTIKERFTSDFDRTIAAFENRVTNAQKKSEELLEVTSIQLNDLYKKAFTEAGKKAEVLEDDTFKKLKTKADERLAQYQQEFAERSTALDEHIKTGVAECQINVDDFKREWHNEVERITADFQEKLGSLEHSFSERLETIHTELNTTETTVKDKNSKLSQELVQFDEIFKNRVESLDATINSRLSAITNTADTKFEEYKKQADFYYAKFDKSIAGIPALSEELEKAQEGVKAQILQEFTKYTATMQEKHAGFEELFSGQAAELADRLEDVTNRLNSLQDDSYASVAEKLQNFESDFLAELTRCSDSLSGDVEKLRNDVAERLTLIGSESESARKDLEDQYKRDLKTRLHQSAEEYKTHFAKLKEQVLSIEAGLEQRITASDQALLNYTGEFKTQIDQTKEKVQTHLEHELSALKLELKDTIRKQTVEVENGTKDIHLWMETMKQEADDQAEMLKNAFDAWKTRTDQQLSDAQGTFNEKIVHFAGLTNNAIENLNSKYQTQYKEFTVKGDESLKTMQQKINALNAKVVSSNETFNKQVREATDAFTKKADELTNILDKKINDATGEAARSLDTMRALVQNLRADTDQAQSDIFERLNKDTEQLAETIADIDKHQNAFIAQTRIFDRTDELKADLEQNIDKLKNEVSRFEVYRNAMDDLSLQYEKVTHLEEEAMQKIARFMSERKSIDLLENEFAKLTVISDSMDKKIVELASANDDLQQYQVQIRRIEESISDVNTRYDRLEKKHTVLDQTVQSIDTAFEDLKNLEKDIKAIEGRVTTIPLELEDIDDKMKTLLTSQEKADKVRRQLETIDDLLSDMESRIDKMHTAREWLANTETRLQDISRNSENQLKLLASLQQSDKPSIKTENGAPPIGTRENVLKLFKSGWKEEAIANALGLSQGEVELILELAEK